MSDNNRIRSSLWNRPVQNMQLNWATTPNSLQPAVGHPTHAFSTITQSLPKISLVPKASQITSTRLLLPWISFSRGRPWIVLSVSFSWGLPQIIFSVFFYGASPIVFSVSFSWGLSQIVFSVSFSWVLPRSSSQYLFHGASQDRLLSVFIMGPPPVCLLIFFFMGPLLVCLLRIFFTGPPPGRLLSIFPWAPLSGLAVTPLVCLNDQLGCLSSCPGPPPAQHPAHPTWYSVNCSMATPVEVLVALGRSPVALRMAAALPLLASSGLEGDGDFSDLCRLNLEHSSVILS